MQLRRYRPADAARLAAVFHRAVQQGTRAVYSQAQRDGWSPTCPSAHRWRARLEGLETWVADVDGRAEGFASFEPDTGYLDLLFVAPEMIGRGLAFALYRTVHARCRESGLSRMTAEASKQSHAFFLRQGWTETGRRNRGEGAACIRTWLMAHDLADQPVR